MTELIDLSFDPPLAQPGPVPVADEDGEVIVVQPHSNRRDVADRLPADPRRRLLDLRQQRDDAFAAYRATSDRVRVLIEEKQDAERRLRRIQDPNQDSFRRTTEDSPAVRELTEQIANLASELVRLREVAEVRGGRSNQAGALVRNVEDFIKNLGDTVRVMPAAAVAAKTAKGEDLVAAVERRRARLRELEADRRKVLAAPIPSSVAKAQARAQIDALAGRGQVSVAPLIEAGQPFRFAEIYSSIVVDGAGGRAVGTNWSLDTEATIAWLLKDQLIAAVEREISECADDANALSPEARAAKLAEIEGDQLFVQREEESLVETAERNGLTIMRRADASPLAVLGIAVKGD